MKKLVSLVLALALIFGMVQAFGVQAAPDDVINFPDANLKAALIEHGVDANKDGNITQGEMAAVETLFLNNPNISNIEGLQYAVNLELLYLFNNQVSDISLLAKLTKLRLLDLDRDQVENISSIANLTNLTSLHLGGNQIKNISPLAKLTSLDTLYIHDNQISDISPLANLTKIKDLSLGDNQISNISPLAKLTKLTGLGLYNNQIENISPLANLTSLITLGLPDNYIYDINPLANLTSLTHLYLNNNRISDINQLTTLTSLSHVELKQNYIDTNSDSSAMQVINNLQNKKHVSVDYDNQYPIPFTRFSGNNRAVTANAIATQGWPEGSDAVILASGASFADALAAAPLAAHYDAPILLTSNNITLGATVLKPIETLKAKNIIIVGGEGSVSKEIYAQLEGLNLNVNRLAGDSRYTTAIEVAKALEADGAEFTSAFLADGTNFPDALSVSPVAGILQQPILFTNKNDTAKVNTDTGEYISSSGIAEIVVIGGGISDAAVADLGVENTSRLSGGNRYTTTVAINQAYKDIFTGDAVTLTTGTNFPDALAGSAFSAKIGAPLFLIGGVLNADVKAAIGGFGAEEFYVYGGGSSLPDGLVLNHIL